jgi:hypothetical protein
LLAPAEANIASTPSTWPAAEDLLSVLIPVRNSSLCTHGNDGIRSGIDHGPGLLFDSSLAFLGAFLFAQIEYKGDTLAPVAYRTLRRPASICSSDAKDRCAPGLAASCEAVSMVAPTMMPYSTSAATAKTTSRPESRLACSTRQEKKAGDTDPVRTGTRSLSPSLPWVSSCVLVQGFRIRTTPSVDSCHRWSPQ